MSKALAHKRPPRQKQAPPAGHRLDVTAGQLLGHVERVPAGYRARSATDKRLGDYRTQIEAMTACIDAAHAHGLSSYADPWPDRHHRQIGEARGRRPWLVQSRRPDRRNCHHRAIRDRHSISSASANGSGRAISFQKCWRRGHASIVAQPDHEDLGPPRHAPAKDRRGRGHRRVTTMTMMHGSMRRAAGLSKTQPAGALASAYVARPDNSSAHVPTVAKAARSQTALLSTQMVIGSCMIRAATVAKVMTQSRSSCMPSTYRFS